MFYPSSHPWADGETLGEHLEKRGVSRRDFLRQASSAALTPRVRSRCAHSHPVNRRTLRNDTPAIQISIMAGSRASARRARSHVAGDDPAIGAVT